MPDRVEAAAPKLGHWAELLSSRRADSFKEQEILPDFLTDFFCGVLGYTRPADGQPRYTISREKRRMSAVDQAYRYAINLPCDWIVVTSVRETRLYYKGRISTPTSASTPSGWPTTPCTSSGLCSCWGPSASCRPRGDGTSIRFGTNRRRSAAK